MPFLPTVERSDCWLFLTTEQASATDSSPGISPTSCIDIAPGEMALWCAVYQPLTRCLYLSFTRIWLLFAFFWGGGLVCLQGNGLLKRVLFCVCTVDSM